MVSKFEAKISPDSKPHAASAAPQPLRSYRMPPPRGCT
jgi:hypothetical protein